MEGDTVFGEAEVLENTIMGGQLKALLESNITIGISSRGVGDMESTIYENEEYYQVLPGYTFVTFDIVAEPSVTGSFMSVMESRDRLRENGSRNQRAQAERKIIVEMQDYLNGKRNLRKNLNLGQK